MTRLLRCIKSAGAHTGSTGTVTFAASWGANSVNCELCRRAGTIKGSKLCVQTTLRSVRALLKVLALVIDSACLGAYVHIRKRSLHLSSVGFLSEPSCTLHRHGQRYRIGSSSREIIGCVERPMMSKLAHQHCLVTLGLLRARSRSSKSTAAAIFSNRRSISSRSSGPMSSC
jgi:hypothetical protein